MRKIAKSEAFWIFRSSGQTRTVFIFSVCEDFTVFYGLFCAITTVSGFCQNCILCRVYQTTQNVGFLPLAMYPSPVKRTEERRGSPVLPSSVRRRPRRLPACPVGARTSGSRPVRAATGPLFRGLRRVARPALPFPATRRDGCTGGTRGGGRNGSPP